MNEPTESTPTVANPSKPRSPVHHRWWRFSIRELLLLTAAVGAFLAWAGLLYQRSRPYQRTAIPDRIGSAQDIQTICQALMHRIGSYSSGGGGSSNMYATTRTFDSQIDLPANLRGPFMDAYRKHVRSVLDKQADGVWGAGSSSDGSGLRGFEFEYAKGSTRGTIVARCASAGDEFSLFVFVHEHDRR